MFAFNFNLRNISIALTKTTMVWTLLKKFENAVALYGVIAVFVQNLVK